MRRSLLAIVVVLASCGLSRADPCQVARLLAPEPYAPTSFGNSIAHSGDYWFIADYRAQVLCTGCGAGAVYVYEMVEGELVYVQTLTSPFPQVADNYGFALAADSDRLVVSSRFGGFPHRADRPGAVFVYMLQDGLWVSSATIEPPLDSAEFGTSLAMDQNVLAISDFDRDRVLVFERQPDDSWQMTDILSPPSDVSPSSWFGVAVAVSGDAVAVGAPFDRSRVANGGSVHLFLRTSSGLFDLEQSMYSDLPERLGWSVASGETDIIFVGAPNASRHFEEQGVVYELGRDAAGWAIQEEIASTNPGRRDDFGSAISLAEERLFVGAPDDGIGAVQWFEKPSDRWEQFGRVTPDTATFSRAFGRSYFSSGGILLVGAPDESDRIGSSVYGAAYQFDLSCTDCLVDLDADGTLTIFDFLAFLNLFQDGDPIADFDGDGELTIFDFLAFQTAFDAGCG